MKLSTTKVGVFIVTMLFLWNNGFSFVGGLFKLNRQCQEKGYYMAEFEFKMLGLAYNLDKGHYAKALTGLLKLRKQLITGEGLITVPKFTDKNEEMEFYLNLQNPRTGAFMDDSYPFCTYPEPTVNVLEHLASLAKETGRPITLKYPLKFLDEINTPEKMKAYLNDISYVGWLAPKFPQTTFHFARDIFGIYFENNAIAQYNLYSFSPETRRTILQWFYEYQDPETGLWGPRSRKTGRLVKKDLHNTGLIVKKFVDKDGNNIYASYPLRYKRELFSTTLQVMSAPIPDGLDEYHEWLLIMGTGSALLTRYLWKDASRESKDKAKELLGNYIKILFKKLYISTDGAFSYYPDSKHATLDGTVSLFGDFKDLGFFSTGKQRRLWGGPEKTCCDLGGFYVDTLTERDFEPILKIRTVNSIRFYAATPDSGDLTAKVIGLYYPASGSVLDVMELIPNLKNWIDTTSQSMGNWNSRQTAANELSTIRIDRIPIAHEKIPLEALKKMVNSTLAAIGFDVLQIPVAKITFHFSKRLGSADDP